MNIFGPTIRILLAGFLASLVLTGCLSDSAEPTIDLDATVIPGTAIALPSATASPSPEPTPSSAPWLPALLEPGPPALVSPVLFFLNGPDAWLIDGELAVRQVTSQRRVRAVETVPGTATAAIALIGSEGGRESEEIRLVDAEGNESAPIYGPEIVADPGGNPRISLLAWSPDGRQLAIVRDDGSIWVTGPDRLAEPLSIEAAVRNIEQVRWSPAGDALLLLTRPDGGAGIIRIVPIDDGGTSTSGRWVRLATPAGCRARPA
ncbi:hypothetical protein BH23CHL2_BH23CHL2_28130 [soil metagenome]